MAFFNQDLQVGESQIPSVHDSYFSGVRGANNMELNQVLASRVAVFNGDITKTRVDAIVNSSNEFMLGQGGADEKLHKEAGKRMDRECLMIGGCPFGEARVTKGYHLMCDRVIHVCTRQGMTADDIRRVYRSALNAAKYYGSKIIALPCIGAGANGVPTLEGARNAIKNIREWLLEDDNYLHVDKIIFCTFLSRDWNVYVNLVNYYFPSSSSSPSSAREAVGEASPPKKARRSNLNFSTSSLQLLCESILKKE